MAVILCSRTTKTSIRHYFWLASLCWRFFAFPWRSWCATNLCTSVRWCSCHHAIDGNVRWACAARYANQTFRIRVFACTLAVSAIAKPHLNSVTRCKHQHDCVMERILLSCAKVTKGISAGGWGQVAHGLRTVIGCCKDRRRRRRRWTDLSRDMSNEQNATRTMPLSRNQSKSAENLRCQRNLFMYFQLTLTILLHLGLCGPTMNSCSFCS